MDFAHLHLHTEFSLLDGTARVGDVIERAKALGMTSIAITDHGSMYGVVDFYRKAVAAGIKPEDSIIFYVLKLIIISFILITPIMYWGIGEWLQSFSSQMDITGDLFLLPLLLTLLITFTTIGLHVIRAALANPIKALRYE